MQNIPQQIINRFVERTPKSQAMTGRAKKVMPGGDTRTGVYYAPYPAFMVTGSGTTLTDLDGNTYLDFLNNFTSLVHGHAHPALMHAARGTLKDGTAYASPMVPQIELAEVICARVPSVELVRFANSGTEATMLALRAARAFTDKSGILKMHGAYHGSHDAAAATSDPEADRGIPRGIYRDVYFADFNDLSSVASILAEHANEIAAILVEPVPMVGGIPIPKPGYLEGLRALADRCGVLLVFDEVVTLRLNEGGYQQTAGVTPDLTAMGKIIGGGFAVGAFGGKREIMMQFDPGRQDKIPHSGTYNGHSQTMAAGLASLRQLELPAINHINGLGKRLATGIDEAFDEVGIEGHTTSVGSLIQVHWRKGEIVNMQDTADGFNAAGDLPYLLHLAMLNRGVFFAARGEFNTSTVMRMEDVNRAVEVFTDALHELKPYIAETKPALLTS
jgi:glutamate-1-semialdehyde 2,1-aminomutase